MLQVPTKNFLCQDTVGYLKHLITTNSLRTFNAHKIVISLLLQARKLSSCINHLPVIERREETTIGEFSQVAKIDNFEYCSTHLRYSKARLINTTIYLDDNIVYSTLTEMVSPWNQSDIRYSDALVIGSRKVTNLGDILCAKICICHCLVILG